MLGLLLGSAVSAEVPGPLVDATWLSAHLGEAGLLIVDIRDPTAPETDYAMGHISGAVAAPYAGFGWTETVDGVADNLPDPTVMAARLGALGLGDDSAVVIVPDGLNSFEFAKAARVYWTLKVLGHDDVAILDGGQVDWVRQGLPLSQEATVAAAATFGVTFRRELLATTARVAGAGATLIDARPVSEFSGKRRAIGVPVKGTIPGAVNLPNSTLYDRRLAARPVIEALLVAAAIKPDQPVITFCNTGLWGSLAWFALSQVAGRSDVALYDGSMAEWAADPARPVQ